MHLELTCRAVHNDAKITAVTWSGLNIILILQPSGAHVKVVSRYALSSTKTGKPILVKFDSGKFYEDLSSHFSFNLDWTILLTTVT
jgi:hypothetical protein